MKKLFPNSSLTTNVPTSSDMSTSFDANVYNTARRYVDDADIPSKYPTFDRHVHEYVGKLTVTKLMTLPRGSRIDLMTALEYANDVMDEYGTRLGEKQGKMIMRLLQMNESFDDFVGDVAIQIMDWCNTGA